MSKLPFCLTCGGHHEPDLEDSYVDFRGYRFRLPFRCMCCGKIICMRQFAYGRCCGPCDTGSCQTGNSAFLMSAVHEHPEWWSYDAQESFRMFVNVVGAEPVSAGEG